MTRRRLAAIVAGIAMSIPGSARAQAPVITELRVVQDGRPVTDPTVLALIDTTVGEPLSMLEVNESMEHLLALNRYDDVRVEQTPAAAGIVLTYVLVPSRPVDRIEFEGVLGLDEGDLRQALRDRYGTAPSRVRPAEAVDLLAAHYRDRGYPNAMVTSRTVVRPAENRSTLVFSIDAGPRMSIKEVVWDGELPQGIRRPDIRAGRPYDARVIQQRLDRLVQRLRENGYYEASAVLAPPVFEPDGVVTTILLRPGRRVQVRFTGDLSSQDQRRLVLDPLRTEASIDETLLEDWTIAIENHLRSQGYRDVRVQRTSSPPGEPELVITFDVRRGPRYEIAAIEIVGAMNRSEAALRAELGIAPGAPFVRSQLDLGIRRIVANYADQGFLNATADADVMVVQPERPDELLRRVHVTVKVAEGTQQIVRSISFSGNASTTEVRLRNLITFAEGSPLSQREVQQSLQRILLDYRDRGFLDVTVRPPLFSTEGNQVDIDFPIVEGPQVIVDRIIIDGNERTSRRIIERELELKVGAPAGDSARIASQNNLSELRLFRRVTIEVRRHGSQPLADVLVLVEETPAIQYGFGGGLEVSSRLRRTESDVTEERLELVPRGFFEIGRLNMWGKNRSVNLFTRVSARSRDTLLDSGAVDTSYGINEYRVYATYREPRMFGAPGEAFVSGIMEQAIRTSYSFETRAVRAEIVGDLTDRLNGAIRYSLDNTRLFDVTLSPEDRPLIDRVFPQVRLSEFSGALIHNTRDDDLDPSRGRFFSFDGALAARAIGSEIGYVKALVEGRQYLQLPFERRIVLALRGLLGAARGFPREAPVLDPDGNPVSGPDGTPLTQIVEDLPASERFFAGGSATHRGFSNDRLGTTGDNGTIGEDGFPKGGNAEVLLNSELRVSLVGSLAGVLFVDAGNVFLRAGDTSLTNLRMATGFGLHYVAPWFRFPVRVEMGFNPDRREIAPGRFERGNVLHVSIGPAF